MSITTTVEQTEISCWCGISFMVPKELYDFTRRENNRSPNSKSIYCPLGHACTWGAETKVQELERQLKAVREDRDATVRRAVAAEMQAAKATRKLKRVEKGVCPECHRHFANVEKHMKTKHAQL